MRTIDKDPDTVRFLMQNAGRYPQLTGDREIQLGRQVQAMMKVLELQENERPAEWESIIGQGQKSSYHLGQVRSQSQNCVIVHCQRQKLNSGW